MGSCNCARSANEALINEFWDTLNFRSKNNSTEYVIKAKKALADRNPDSELRREFKSHLLDDSKCAEVWGLLKTWHRNELYIYLFLLLKKDTKTQENFIELIQETNVDLIAGDMIRADVLSNMFYNYASCISKECYDYLKPQSNGVDLKEVYSNSNLSALVEKKMPKQDISLKEFFTNLYPYLNNDDKIRDDLLEVYYERKRKGEDVSKK
jgi:hypothetical protein